MPEDDRMLIQAAARVVLVGDRGPLASQLDRLERVPPSPPPLDPDPAPGADWPTPRSTCPTDLLFPNGLGGFRADGREYCILVRRPGHARRRPQRHGPPPGRAAAAPDPAPRPLGQRRRQPVVRVRRLRGRARGSPGPATASRTA